MAIEMETVARADGHDGGIEEATNKNNVNVKKVTKLGDGTIDTKNDPNGSWWDRIETDDESEVSDISAEEAAHISDEILNDHNTLWQIDQLRILKNKYDTWSLDSHQNFIYEQIMERTKKELDKSAPSAVKMNKFIDKWIREEVMKYYDSHKDEAAHQADKMVNYKSMNDVELVGNVIARSEYLWKNSKKKLYAVVNKVIEGLDEDTKSILNNESNEK